MSSFLSLHFNVLYGFFVIVDEDLLKHRLFFLVLEVLTVLP